MPSGSNSTIITITMPNRPGSKPGVLAMAGRQVVAHQCNGLRQPADEDGAENGAVDRAEPADDHHQQQLDRQQQVEGVGRDESHLVGQQRAREPSNACAQRKCDRLVLHEIDAEALRGDFRVADGDHGAPRGRSREVDGGEHDENEHGKTEIVKLPWLGQREAEEVGGWHRHSLEAPRHRFPADDELLDDLREGQRGDCQVDAGHAVGRHRHGDACRHGGEPGDGKRDEERHALGDQIGVGIGADRHEGAVPQADEPREADQQHEPDAGDRQDEDVGELADVEVAEHQAAPAAGRRRARRTRKPAPRAETAGCRRGMRF